MLQIYAIVAAGNLLLLFGNTHLQEVDELFLVRIRML
jgi:hypothetical protein